MFNRRVIGGVLLILAAAGTLVLWFTPTNNDQEWLLILGGRDVGPSRGVGPRGQPFVIDLGERFRKNGTLESREWTLRALDEAGQKARIYRRTVYYKDRQQGGGTVSVVTETPWRKTTAPLASELASPGAEDVLVDDTPLLARPAIRATGYGVSAALGLGGLLLLLLPRPRRRERPCRDVTVEPANMRISMNPLETVRFACPRCGKRLKAKAALAGKRIRCPDTACGQSIPVPSAIAVAAPAERLRVLPVASPPTPSRQPQPVAAWRLSRNVVALLVGGMVAAAFFLSVGVVLVVIAGRGPANENARTAKAATDDLLAEAKSAAPTAPKPSPPKPSPPQPAQEKQPERPPGSKPKAPVDEASSQASKPPVKKAEPKQPAPPAPTPPVGPTAAAVQAALAKQVVLTGSVLQESRTQAQGINGSITFLRWHPRLELKNQSELTIEFGSDLLLFELNSDSSALEGVAVFGGGASTVTNHNTYGLVFNWQSGGMRTTISGSMMHFSFGGEPTDFGPAAPGATWKLDRVLEEGTWLRDDLRTHVLVVLPEARVKSSAGTEKCRWLAYFRKPASGTTWTLADHKLIPIRKDELQKLVKAPASTLVTRVLAANFLAEAYPADAVPLLADTANGLNEGQMLATCLELLTNLKGAGVAPHALVLLEKAATPNGIRHRAARYLGAAKHEPAFDLLARSARDSDRGLAEAAIWALGEFGGPRAAAVLLAMLKDGGQSHLHGHIAVNLARTKDAKAIASLQDLASRGNKDALQALVGAGLPETFSFFVELAKQPRSREERDQITRGLRNSGKEKAFPVLLEMLERDKLPPPKDVYDIDTLVSELATLVSPATCERLIKLARAGNVRALQVLAHAKDESVRQPLTELAGETTGIRLQIVVHALAQNWPKKSVAVFAKALGGADEEVVRHAINGLQQSKDPRAAELLVPVLEHPKPSLRRDAAWAMANLPAGKQLAPVAAVLLKTADQDLTAPLVKVLIDGGWNDKAAIPRLGDKLRTMKGYQHYDLIRLLRHLSDNAMGPRDSNEYYRDEQGWTRKWVAWARR